VVDFNENKDHPLHQAYMASGAYGQFIIIIPKSNMVIITKNYERIYELLNKIFDLNIKIKLFIYFL